MKSIRNLALIILGLVMAACACADFLAPHSYTDQFREHAGAPPSRDFLLGTDDLGRDRFARLLEGMRISLFCACSAALMATAIGAALGLVAGYVGGWMDQTVSAVTDLFLSLPWLFALLSLRALVPLNFSPWLSIATLFLLLALVGWPAGARVVRASTSAFRVSQFAVYGRAYGCSRARLLWRHILPNLRPVLTAQFCTLVPIFLLTEANLGLLGLGIAEPMPSLGNMLSELQNYQRIPEQPWILAPAALLVIVVACLHIAISKKQRWEPE
jgi:peptide/nickel transport system permease protein